MKPTDRIYVALDTTDLDHGVQLAGQLKGHVGGMKVGKEFFTALGPNGVEAIRTQGMPIFLDLKFHDIPNTVASAIRAAKPLGPEIINVHASGGKTMMVEAKKAAVDAGIPLAIAVTILTALDQNDLDEIGYAQKVEDQVVRLAQLAKESEMDGVVCSAREIEAIRSACGDDFKLIVPGIRPKWAVSGDQKRIMTPRDALEAGADYLVIGRPITGAENPVEAAQKIADEIA